MIKIMIYLVLYLIIFVITSYFLGRDAAVSVVLYTFAGNLCFEAGYYYGRRKVNQ